ncbi:MULTISPECIES: Xaa-Pro peptidase family protein [Halobacterium]|uniref:Peptidase M24 family protein (Homolog to Xaa-Prodipeptidase) n=3 Tax=Halobacterium salinarum TaxID=2242 RepID=Q9HQC0_HALSA|nr:MULTISPECIES: Xaa-Pro peptidase family protein [Halobacterium]AAG19595.1 X-pro aminopeptidase homolog [Halobacterium salinarum NRC-1]MBB6090284.1 Xaa-Pro aminopeptidase [Halobacterium salinarum]MDL0118995.1 Xaa-Pro peptidase family protein [Halobacterium salinarum]MDL0122103.1 Xaa-Pro peptidase family protein [Halobacterium salinarum]MDL0124012.1 Xaa-Pro peptidase family protein [Halobacterium salinarum]
MDPDFSQLDEFLEDSGVDGYAFHDDDSNSDLYYLAGFDAPDPFFAVYTPAQTGVLVSPLEYGRASKAARADVVARHSDYDLQAKREEYGPRAAKERVLAEFVADLGCESLAVGERFPVGTADALRDHEITVEPDEDNVVEDIRATKTEAEIEHVREAQRANEAAMARAEELIRGADREDGVLVRDDGQPLTSEYVRQEIEIELLRHGCALDDTIVAGGAQAADAHERGSGPLPADDPVVVDIFPRSKDSKYHSDMTRTFANGDPSDAHRERYAVTRAAFEAALDAIEPGVTGEAVNQAVIDVFDDHGYPNVFADPDTESGFIHSTGHGVGLDVHEMPAVSQGGDELHAGNVITIEPGLYEPGEGGVRIEDIVVVTEDGYENLTDYEIALTD